MALLEGTEAAVVTSSGMAAISSTLLALLRSGDHLLIQACCSCTCASKQPLQSCLRAVACFSMSQEAHRKDRRTKAPGHDGVYVKWPGTLHFNRLWHLDTA